MIKRLVLEKADRVYHLPPALDDFLPRKERKMLLGREVLDLARIVWPSDEDASTASGDQCPADSEEITRLAEKTAAWYQQRFGIVLNPNRELFIGGSIRQMLNLLGLAFFNPGDVVLVPDPGVWHYRAAAALASAQTIPYTLTERNHFKPAPTVLAGNLARLAKAIIINSPHNPSGAVLSQEDFSGILHLARRENLMLILDQAFEGLAEANRPASFYALPGGRKTAVEFYSYRYNMGAAGPSIGFAVGQPGFVAGLARMAGIFNFCPSRRQVATALAACAKSEANIAALQKRITRNRNQADEICRRLQALPAGERTSPFYWAKLRGRKQSRHFCRRLYLRSGILAVPGAAFGENGEGFVRLCLTAPPETYAKAVEAAGRFFLTSHERKTGDG